MALLEVKDLKMYYKVRRGDVKAVDGVSFEIEKGEAMGLAGESGCGKSSMATTLLRLLPNNGRILDGSIKFDGKEILDLPEEHFRQDYRWQRMSIIFQGAMNALNPVHRIGKQISEAIITHENVSKNEAKKRAEELLEMVGINSERYRNYPHEFSGGMKQRAVIAMALACNPDLIIADEPTTALDVMVQAQVLEAIQSLRKKMGLSMLLISHDLSVIAQTCDKVAIMYAGRIVEYGPSTKVYNNPLHPYSYGLLSSFPDIMAPRSPIQSIPGSPPNLLEPPSGCRFSPRCPLADSKCFTDEPELMAIDGKNHLVACHKAGALGKVGEQS